ncbi:hypothetical protein LNP24_14935 [Klebsiella pneumoniae subsp. pneumoniae]|nr:hypothetical protein [Klebsiella pneumoniae subsp. pneumoniae]
MKSTPCWNKLPQETVAVVVPAMPQSRRILVGGYSVIDSVALSRTDVARDVRTPVTESWVPGLLAAQTHHQVGHIALTSVMKGEGQIQQDLQEQQQRGVRVMSGRCDNRRRCRWPSPGR